MGITIRNVAITGYKTLADVAGEHSVELHGLNVFIGPNGAGKTNFISFFRLLSWMLTPPGKLQEYIARQGGASNLLTDGPGNTREITFRLQLEAETGADEYAFRLAYVADDTLIFTEEGFRYTPNDMSEGTWHNIAAGKREAQIVEEAAKGNQTARVIHNLLRRVVVYQFHNTSETARIRGKWNQDDGQYLKEDGANLAAVLYRLQTHATAYYRRIVATLRLILPFFEDFELNPEYGALLLRWREKYSNRVFTASQAADGMLRAMALVALLLLPEEELPDVLVLDEPELGLHPAAIGILGGLIRSVSSTTQVILATQSLPLVDCFEPEDIVITDRGYDGYHAMRVGRYTRFRRLDHASLQHWLNDYSLSELWEKNILGGRP